jgi:hypothetical protein
MFEEECFLVQLPRDLLIHKIFLCLDSVRDVVALQQTCKTLYSIGQDETVWKAWSFNIIKVFHLFFEIYRL